MSQQLIDKVKDAFVNKFNEEPLLIFSPGRINIIGEHTDYNEGFVFPAAINKGIVAAIGKSKTDTSSAYSLDYNNHIKFNLQQIKPSKNGGWENYILGIVAEIKKANKTIGNFNVIFKGNIPTGAGMSSSAALENSIVFGLNTLFELNLSKHEMIMISQRAEHNYVGVKCGIMDQYASMFGIKNSALHLDCRTIEATPYKIDLKEYELVLINTNVNHQLSDSSYNDRRNSCENAANILNIKALRDASEKDLLTIKNKLTLDDYNKALYIIQENQRTIKAADAIKKEDLFGLGQLIYQSHNGLSQLFDVSCNELDFLVNATKENKDILGARMMGGGFGGCTINLIKKTATESFTKMITEKYKQQFNNECAVYFVTLSQGTHIV